MIEKRKTDLRVYKTKKAIIETFKQMVLEMDAGDITIKELTDRALIHRKTFYLHYNSIESLYDEIFADVMEDYYKEIDKLEKDAPFTETNKVFFTFLSNQEPYIEKIIYSSSYRDFSDKFFYKMITHNRNKHNPYKGFTEAEQNLINTFLGVSSVNLYRQWIRDKKNIPLKKLISLSGKLFMNGISSVTK